jgi:hypothetical protein
VNIKLNIAIVLLVVFSACKKDNNEEPLKRLLLSKVSIENSDRLTIDIKYENGKAIDVKEITRNNNLTRFSNFAFDTRERIVAFKSTNSLLQSTIQETQFTFVGSNLQAVKASTVKNGAEEVVATFIIDNDANVKSSLVLEKDGKSTRRRTATYNDSGNIVRLISKSLLTGTADTTEFSNYDSHPSGLAFIDLLHGENDFLPPSKNNPGKIKFNRSVGQDSEEVLNYEYNQQGFPVKIISSRQTILLEYEETE